MQNFFADRVWSPLGSRPHILLTGSTDLAAYAASINARARRWWERQPGSTGRRWDDLVREVPGHYLHITLTWLDRLTTEVDAAELRQLSDELVDRFAALSPTEVRIGEPMVRTHAVELYVHPSPQLNAIAAQARAALRVVLGDDAAPEPPQGKPWRPHLSTFYGNAEFDSAGLAETLLDGPAPAGGHTTVLTMPAEGILVDQDTFRDEGFWWDTATARSITVGGRSAAGR